VREASEIVDEQIEAYVRGDARAFASFYEEDAVCADLPSGRVVAAGVPAIEQVWAQVFARGRMSFALRQRIELDRFVVDFECVAIAGGSPKEAVAIYEVGPERIRRVWFIDPSSG